MTRNNTEKLNCSLAKALNLIGEYWAVLILQESFYGARRFDDFQNHLGIARNILTNRLKNLCDSGIMERTPIKQGGKRHEYKLTPMGRNLYPTLIVLTQWGDRWLHGPDGPPVRFIDRTTGKEIADVSIRAQDGREIKDYELELVPGPGANDTTRQRCQRLADIWQKSMAHKKHKTTK